MVRGVRGEGGRRESPFLACRARGPRVGSGRCGGAAPRPGDSLGLEGRDAGTRGPWARSGRSGGCRSSSGGLSRLRGPLWGAREPGPARLGGIGGGWSTPGQCQRPHHCERTGSRQLPAVKRSRVWLVPRSVTAWESQMPLARVLCGRARGRRLAPEPLRGGQ